MVKIVNFICILPPVPQQKIGKKMNSHKSVNSFERPETRITLKTQMQKNIHPGNQC